MDLSLINDMTPAQLVALITQLSTSVATADRHARAKTSLIAFAQAVYPGFEAARHAEKIAEVLEQIESGKIRRLIIAMPPRHGKTMLLRLFTAWYLGLHPAREIIYTSYSGELAEQSGAAVKDHMFDEDYAQIFPDVRVREDSRSRKRFELESGGKFTAVGMGGTITGKGAHLLIIDDPIKGAAEADSPSEKEKHAQWYQQVASTRLQNEGRARGAVIICATRWAEDDLTGWVQEYAKHENWQVLSLPAICEDAEKDALGRKLGEALWPERYDREQLLDQERTMTVRGWNALYQQRPSALKGNIFQREWWQKWPKNVALPDFEMKFIGIDIALSERKQADFSALVTVGIYRDTNRVAHALVLNTMHKRVRFYELRQDIHDAWHAHQGEDCDCYLLCESSTASLSLLQELQRSGLPVYAMKPTGDKIARAHAVCPLLELGKVWYLDSPENQQLIDQCANFPNAAHDDMVDAFVWTLLKMRSMNLIAPKAEKDVTDDGWDEERPFLRRKRRGYW